MASSFRFITGLGQCYTRSIKPTIETEEKGKVGRKLSGLENR